MMRAYGARKFSWGSDVCEHPAWASGARSSRYLFDGGFRSMVLSKLCSERNTAVKRGSLVEHGLAVVPSILAEATHQFWLSHQVKSSLEEAGRIACHNYVASACFFHLRRRGSIRCGGGKYRVLRAIAGEKQTYTKAQLKDETSNTLRPLREMVHQAGLGKTIEMLPHPQDHAVTPDTGPHTSVISQAALASAP